MTDWPFEQLKTPLTLNDIDNIISAERPRNPGPLRDAVNKHMIHSSDHLTRTYSRCRKNGKCSYHYPYSVRSHTSVNAQLRVDYRRRAEEDSWVVPYSPALLLLWDGHCNVEAIFTVDVFLYIYKYLFKGPDYTDMAIRPCQSDKPQTPVDDFIRARYMSAMEAVWRLNGYPLSHQNPSVTRLAIHEEGRNRHQYRRSTNQAPAETSSLLRYFARPLGEPFDDMRYTSYHERYMTNTSPPRNPVPVWDESCTYPHMPRHVVYPRQRNIRIARIQSVRPGTGDVFYLRSLLFHRAARSFQDLRTIDGVVHETYQSAARAAGLFEESDEGECAMEEAVADGISGGQLRFLFVLLILEGSPALPMWDRFKDDLARDFGGNINGAVAPYALNQALGDIQRLLQERGKDASIYSLPYVEIPSAEVDAELSYFAGQRASLLHASTTSFASMTQDQQALFNRIECLIHPPVDHPPSTQSKLLFITGKAGTGKTFVIDAALACERSKSVVIAVAGATALSASLYDRGQTGHSLWKLPVTDNSLDVISTISTHSTRADYLRRCSAIIFDELPMFHKSGLEAIDQIMRILMDVDEPFGGKPFIGVGDFRQVAPVVKGGGPTAAYMASVLSSSLWDMFDVCELSQPMRNASDIEFSSFLDSVGEDVSGSRVNVSPYISQTDDVDDALAWLFPPDILANPELCARRAFLTTLNINVDSLNERVLDTLAGERGAVMYSSLHC